MKATISIITAVVIFIGYLCGSTQNVNIIKANAEATWSDAGFKIVGYEGYQRGTFENWGGKVWYIIQKKEGDQTLYHGYLSKWGSEFHIYNLKAIDAIGSR